MIINLDELNIKNNIDINLDVFKDEDLDKRIIDLKNAKVVGNIHKNSNEDIILECTFQGDMILADSITLDEIPYSFTIDISDNLDNLIENCEECYEKMQNTLDLKKILWQNIVLEVPISYSINKDANLKGEGWELLKEENKSKEIDPRLKDLEKLLKGDD